MIAPSPLKKRKPEGDLYTRPDDIEGKALVCEVPFFLDEIHSLDTVNRPAVLSVCGLNFR